MDLTKTSNLPCVSQCSATIHGIDLTEVLDCMSELFLRIKPIDEGLEYIGVIDNWKNGLDAKGNPLCTNIKPAK